MVDKKLTLVSKDTEAIQCIFVRGFITHFTKTIEIELNTDGALTRQNIRISECGVINAKFLQSLSDFLILLTAIGNGRMARPHR